MNECPFAKVQLSLLFDDKLDVVAEKVVFDDPSLVVNWKQFIGNSITVGHFIVQLRKSVSSPPV